MKYAISLLVRTQPYHEARSLNAGLFILRFCTGLALCIVFEKFFPRENIWGPQKWFIEDVSRMGFPFPVFFAWLAVLSEFFGGILLVIGLFTRMAALLNFFVTFTAAFLYHKADIGGSGILSFFFMIICLTILLTGPGTLSMDYWLTNRKKKKAGVLWLLLISFVALPTEKTKAAETYRSSAIVRHQYPADSTEIVFFLKHNQLLPKKYTLIIYNAQEEGNNTRVKWFLPFEKKQYRLPKGSKIYLATTSQIAVVMQGNRIDGEPPFLLVNETAKQKVFHLKSK